ncbi:hypothetical protein EMPS_09796 [Entomortierella parvispora]|uniref:G domain-containing protein n=1 Tax=Entomortierella parvispora TaxID=205924 RepID=A0A9P3M0Q2_9FUNG|nr:hypothetical protein EMPS_09796 [Entomortierella parvispora]
MSLEPSCANRMPIAVMFIGNIGAGKSALLSQIGGRFSSGVKFREGFTKEISERRVVLGTDPPVPAVLMDIPGLFEPDEKGTKGNCKVLTRALKKDYNFKLVFVLKADNRGPSDQDLVLMSKVNSSVREANAQRKVEFQVIVNQIMDDDVYDMYKQFVAHDNFRSFFGKLKIENFSFDIQIKTVSLLMHDKGKINNDGFAKEILMILRGQTAIKISLLKDISVTNEELSLFAIARAHAGSFFAGAAAATGVIAWIISSLYEAHVL